MINLKFDTLCFLISHERLTVRIEVLVNMLVNFVLTCHMKLVLVLDLVVALQYSCIVEFGHDVFGCVIVDVKIFGRISNTLLLFVHLVDETSSLEIVNKLVFQAHIVLGALFSIC